MTSDQAARFGKIKNVLIVVLALNWAVAIAKIAFGLATRFTSMTADGFHSLSDGASNIIGIVGITLACRPADKDHPYGHRKYETLFSLGIAALLFFVCFELLSKAIERFHHPINPEINAGSLIVMLVTMVVNILVMGYENKQGKLLKSDILISDSIHTKADIFTSLSVIVAIIVIRIGYPILDPIVTVMIALFVAYAAFSIARRSSGVLCDAIILDGKKIENIVLSIKGVRACHKIRTRGREDDIYVDLHVQVNPDMHVDKAHKICYEIEGTIKASIPGVTDVVVHVEPKK
ncbi:MAG: cation diffusion facilitator family transporter [Candidatus Omnitrophota bacterium]|nr:cation diffusion facilitator family transporter [Candidatus Omnitrophota bacterium]